MRTPVRFGCGVLLTAALTLFYPGSDRSSAFAATTITVTTTGTGIPGALDQAILQGNTSSPPVTINFAIQPFNGTVQTIVLQSNLPAITSPLAINGFTQSGSSPGAFPGTLTNNPVLLIALDGSTVSAVQTSTGLTFAVAGSVEGLIIQNFTNGIAVSVTNGVTLSENAISNNLVGVQCSGDTNSITGNVFVLNGTAVQLLGSSNTVTANVITNNLNDGLDVFGANNNVIGNLISANSSNGVALANGANSLLSNIISSNTGAGVVIDGNNNTLSNNTISANDADGVDILGSSNVLVNSTVLTNLGAGVNVGAFIGTTNGNNSLSNDILSANGGGGVILAGGANSLVASTISNNTGDGVLVSGTANIIGGPASGAGNVVIQNTGNGIKIAGGNEPSLLPADANVVQGNFIGTDASGTNSLGNNESGVLIDGTLAEASTNLIGGESSGQANTIAFNDSNGVTVVSNAVDNAIFANSIFSNAVLGIDLGADGVTSNHPFGTFPTGPNNFQNFPVLTAILCSNAGVLIQGSITNSTGGTTAHLEFFANSACDPSGFGQGQTFFGSADVTTDLSGGAAFSLPFANSDLVGEFITATASDSSSNTSEFSQCILMPDFTNAVITINNCSNITASVGSAQSSAVVTFPTPTAVNTCSMPTTVTCVPASGSIFPLGTTPVTCTAVDTAGNTASCTFSVTVTAPEQVIVDIAPGFCPAVVNTKEGGVIQVAIVGTQSLNITNIIPASVTLNGVLSTTNSFITNSVAAPFVYTRGCDKKKRDGTPDLIVEFDVNELIASLGTVKNGEVKVLTVNGTQNIIGSTITTNGTTFTTNKNVVVGTTTFEGQDEIKISTKKSQIPKGLKNPF
jgi:parallel beta-helix repeat protein